jgi:hypothetical protein
MIEIISKHRSKLPYTINIQLLENEEKSRSIGSSANPITSSKAIN